jgi:integrase
MSKRVAPLTALQLTKLKPDPKNTIELVDGAVPGLRFRLSPAGTKSWSLNIRRHGKMRRFLVGSNLGLKEARIKALEIRRLVAEGADPTAVRSAERKRVRDASQGVGTLKAIIEGYFNYGGGKGLKTGAAQCKVINLVFKKHLSRVALTIKSSELQLSVDEYKSAVMGARAVSYLWPVLKWAGKRDFVTGTFSLEKPLCAPPQQRVLKMDELQVLLPEFNDCYGRCCKFMLMTGVRLDSACSATWSQIDLVSKFWIVPPENQKDTRSPQSRLLKVKSPFVIPLSIEAINLLDEVSNVELLRRSVNGNNHPISSDDYVFVGSRGGKLANWDRWLKKLSPKTMITRWSPHALRRTTATLAGNLGAAPHVIEVILNHSNVGGQLVAGYNKSVYAAEHSLALNGISKLLSKIGSGTMDD